MLTTSSLPNPLPCRAVVEVIGIGGIIAGPTVRL